ncbi:nuclear transport factor 2 family protein [bacterium]|nr:nuclear transport factor 2 family protein [bacterium]
MSDERFKTWLQAYGKAWEEKDAEAFVALFSKQAYYHWTPFRTPYVGHEQIAAAFNEAVSTQENITFHFTRLNNDGFPAVAHWRTTLNRIGSEKDVVFDGILTVEFDDEDGLCRVFREWSHSSEEEEQDGSVAGE